MLYSLIKKILFSLPAETAHDLSKQLNPFSLKIFASLTKEDHPCLKSKIGTQTIQNPIGLAAGFDKNAEALDLINVLGFGFAEIGSVTLKAYDGNPKPRLFRLAEDSSLINRLGLPNKGAEALLKKLQNRCVSLPLGINIAKAPGSKSGRDDIIQTLQKLEKEADYIAINLSCPNTSDGRTFEDPQAYKELARDLAQTRKRKNCPYFIKISPDLNEGDLKKIVEISEKEGFDGFIVGNTTKSRPALKSKLREIGGLSGAALSDLALQQQKKLTKYTSESQKIMAVGGIMSFKDLMLRLIHGADYFQIYSGLVYQGPFFVKNLNKSLKGFIKKEGFSHYLEIKGQKGLLKKLKEY